jgi:LysM repeat protein
MKEMIYNEKETDNSDEIRVPKNIRQIGEPPQKRKIYIEDYVVNTLKKKNDNEEIVKYGVLLGEIKRNKEEICVFVNGLVESREIIEHSIIFNDGIWKDINNDIKNYFEGMQIVGWFASSPYISGKEMSSIKKLHLDNFAGNDKICFLCDRNEKEEQIFIYEKGELKKQSGYYVYYERNDRLKKYLKQTAGERGISISAKESLTNNSNNSIDNTGRVNALEKRSNAERVKILDKDQSSIGDLVRQYADGDINKGIRGRISYGFSGILIIALLLSTIVMLNNYGELKDLRYSIDSFNESDNAKAVNELLSSVLPEKNEESGYDNIDSSKKHEDTNGTDEKTDVRQNIGADSNTSELKQNSQSEDEDNIREQNSQTERAVAKNSGASIYSGMYHTVKKGQTLYDISVSYYGTGNMVEQIKAMNGIDDDYVIKEGQKIILP